PVVQNEPGTNLPREVEGALRAARVPTHGNHSFSPSSPKNGPGHMSQGPPHQTPSPPSTGHAGSMPAGRAPYRSYETSPVRSRRFSQSISSGPRVGWITDRKSTRLNS